MDERQRPCAPPPIEHRPLAASPIEPIAPPKPLRMPAPPISLRWPLWTLVVLASLWILPGFVERVQYSLTRGRMQAEVDSARKQLPSPAITEISQQFAVIAKAIGPSVVHINSVQSLTSERGRRVTTDLVQGQGTGVIVDEEGYILTNYHVVEGAEAIEVRLNDHEFRMAELVGHDPLTDLAVIKIPSGGLVAALWGDSDALQVGSLVWAVGNPFGLDRSVTFGIISAKNRRMESSSPYQDFLQTDAAVNPGNSGGPLVDGTGRVVGINTAIVGPAYRGVSFSIPSAVAQDVYQRLKSSGRVERGFLGVRPVDLLPQVAEQLGLGSLEGALVEKVEPNTPAARASIQANDVIVQWNGHPVGGGTDLRLLIASTQVGSTAKAILMRAGERIETDVVLEELSPAKARGR